MPRSEAVERAPNGIGHQAGNGTYLTPELHAAFIKAIRKGNYITTVCKSLGISRFTYYGWMRKGEPEDVTDADGNVIGTVYPDTRYGRFHRDMDNAQAGAEINAVEAMTSHFEDDWRAAAEFLARKFPERWNPKVAVELTGKDGGPVEIDSKREALFAKLDSLVIEGEERSEIEFGDEAKAIEPGDDIVDAEIVDEGAQQLRMPI